MPETGKSPLYEVHSRLGARFVVFSGWRMPLEYSGVSSEHHAVRKRVGLFDLSHMGEVRISGANAAAFLDYVLTNSVARLQKGRAQYSIMASPEGGVLDDIVLFRLDADEYMAVVNASNTDKDLNWLRAHNRFGVQIDNISSATALLGLQGPLSETVLQPLTSIDLTALRYYGVVRGNVSGVEGVLSRTGYTGEDGFEFYFPEAHSKAVWDALMEAGQASGIVPAGLAARNTLRLEAAMLLWGNDLDETTSPLEAGLESIIKLDKGEFIGRSAIAARKASGVERKLIGFEMLGREIARDGYPAFVDGRQAGRVTSGAPAITLDKNIGLAYLPVGHAAPGTLFEVQVRKRRCEARVAPTPFYERRRSV